MEFIAIAGVGIICIAGGVFMIVYGDDYFDDEYSTLSFFVAVWSSIAIFYGIATLIIALKNYI